MKLRQIVPYRKEFWKYCENRDGSLRSHCKRLKVPFDIDKYFIDQLFIDQKFCCAISKIPFEPPRYGVEAKRHPFGPSLDRIVPKLGYVKGNVRLVCTMVNLAMSNWGVESLWTLVRTMGTQEEPRPVIFRALQGQNPKTATKTIA